MHIRFAEIDDQFIKSQVAEGFYTNESELVRDAVRRMREQREQTRSPFYEAVMKGHRQIERGETIPFTPQLMEEIRASAKERAARGDVVNNPEAVPDDFRP